MSNYNSLKTTIDANIKQNGRQEITGQILNSVLNQMVTSLGAGYQFMGVATPETNPSTPDQNVFYLASEQGNYVNFGNLSVDHGCISIFYYNGNWSKEDLYGDINKELFGLLDSGTQYSTGSGDFANYAVAFYPILTFEKKFIIELTNVNVSTTSLRISLLSSKSPFSGAIVASLVPSIINDSKFELDISNYKESGAKYIGIVQNTASINVSFTSKAYIDESIFGNYAKRFSTLPDNSVDVAKLSDKAIASLQPICATGDSSNAYIYISKPIENGKTYVLKIVANANFTATINLRSAGTYTAQVQIIEKNAVFIANEPHYVRFTALGDGQYIHIDQDGATKNIQIFQGSSFAIDLAQYSQNNYIELQQMTYSAIKSIMPLYAKNAYRLQRGDYEFLTRSIEENGIYLLVAKSKTSVNGEYINLRSAVASTAQIQQIISYSSFTENVPRYAIFTAQGNGQYLSWNATTTEFEFEIYRIDKLDLSIPAIAPNDILGLNPMSLYDMLIGNAARPSINNSQYQISPFVLGWFTDIHQDQWNISRIIKFMNHYRTYIDDIIHTGDMVYNRFDDSQDSGEAYYKWWHGAGADNILNVIGNHDVWLVNGGYDVTGKQAYDKFFAPFISGWNVTQPANAEQNGYCYYYKDYSTKGIRLVVLDCMHYDDTQNTWLQNTLSSAKNNNLSVIIANHYAGGELNHIDCSFDSIQKRNQPMTAINADARLAVDSFISDGGEFICWIGGHQHTDYFATLKLSPNQLCIILDTGRLSDNSDQDSIRIAGTKSQDCFNILAIDTYAKMLKIVRVGNDYDTYLRHKGILTYNYQTHQLIQSI